VSAEPTTNTTVSADRTPDPLAVIERGLAVFPLPPGGRQPNLRGWQDRCISDPAVARRLWVPGDNIGVGCRASNLVGVDLDRGETNDGVTAFADLCATHGQRWPDTLTVRTPHGGLHLYFRAPAGSTIRSTSGGRAGLGPGVDTRGPGRHRGGYLVGPGSIVDGTSYLIARDNVIQQLPDWLADLLDDRPRTTIPLAAKRHHPHRLPATERPADRRRQ
jgi:hypothetical protein